MMITVLKPKTAPLPIVSFRDFALFPLMNSKKEPSQLPKKNIPKQPKQNSPIIIPVLQTLILPHQPRCSAGNLAGITRGGSDESPRCCGCGGSNDSVSRRAVVSNYHGLQDTRSAKIVPASP